MSNIAQGAATLPTKSFTRLVGLALALSAAAALSLGLARFAYALLLPAMKADLAWSYSLAGFMNTSNALGYLLGALTLPSLLRRTDAASILVWGCVAATLAMLVSGFLRTTEGWLLQRCIAGIFSAWIFMTGGILAARLGSEVPEQSGLLIGLFYGGVGFGIIGASLFVPWVLNITHWSWGWWVLAAMSIFATIGVLWPANTIRPWLIQAVASQAKVPLPWKHFLPTLLAYVCFGLGYIAYMTFIIADLKDQGASTGMVVVFYSLLGLGVVVSGRLWAGLLTKYADGKPIALLNALLGLAVLLAALRLGTVSVLISGFLFGCVFLSVVASTTAIVRHQLPTLQWTQGITLFTVVFAVGQMVGPTVVGLIADGQGSLTRGFLISSLTLWIGAIVALFQGVKQVKNESL